ncbi:MAG: class I SAM-dependent methyltransferase [Fimbriimonas sp.]
MHSEAQETQTAMWQASAQAWDDFVEQDLNRTHLLDHVMLRLGAPYAGMRVLDVGCGEGRWCRRLAGEGAITVGLDPAAEFLELARARHPEGTYVEGVAEALPFPDEAFDLVVSYVSLVDIPDAEAGLTEMVRVLRPGGHLLISNLNAWITTREKAWYTDADGKRLHVAVEDYFDPKAIAGSWRGISVMQYHRPFEMVLQPLLRAGLQLLHFEEPRPSAETVAAHPEMDEEYRVPFFYAMKWRKPEGG